jgi:hypothetical protein
LTDTPDMFHLYACGLCGALAWDEERHKRWHRRRSMPYPMHREDGNTYSREFREQEATE